MLKLENDNDHASNNSDNSSSNIIKVDNDGEVKSVEDEDRCNIARPTTIRNLSDPTNTSVSHLKRQLGLRLHPDKIEGKEYEFRKVFESDDIGTILEVAFTENMDLNCFGVEELSEMEEALYAEESEIQSTNAWAWFESKEKKRMLIQMLGRSTSQANDHMLFREEEFWNYLGNSVYPL